MDIKHQIRNLLETASQAFIEQKSSNKANDKESGKYEIKTTVKEKDTAPMPDFLFVYQQFIIKLAKSDVNRTDLRIFLLFLGESAYKNLVVMHIESISETLGVSRQTVHRSLKRLMQENIILRQRSTGNDRRTFEYYLNPVTAWKGWSTERPAALRELHKENPNQLKLFNQDFSKTESQSIKKQLKSNNNG